MTFAFKIGSEKRTLRETERQVLGQHRCIAQRVEGGIFMSRFATKRTGENLLWVKNHPPIKTEQEAAKHFSAVIIDFSTGELAQATGRSKETVKCWKQGRAFPNGVSLMDLMREYPVIESWVRARNGQFDDPRTTHDAFAYLESVMSRDDAQGRAMRARALELARGSA